MASWMWPSNLFTIASQELARAISKPAAIRSVRQGRWIDFGGWADDYDRPIRIGLGQIGDKFIIHAFIDDPKKAEHRLWQIADIRWNFGLGKKRLAEVFKIDSAAVEMTIGI